MLLFFVVTGCVSQPAHKDGHSQSVDTLVIEHPTDPPEAMDGAEVVVKPGDDLVAVFGGLSSDVQRIVFQPGKYIVRETLVLPRTGSLVVIEGNGARLRLASGIVGFYSMPANKRESMDYNKTRYLIRDFGSIDGGAKAIQIGSSFNTVIRNIEFIGQQEAAIDLVFCLMSTLENILVTNPFNDGIVLRSAVNVDTGVKEWDGASTNNSQCNHSVLRSCRVYNRKGGTGTSFKILQSTGVRLVDCISEGYDNSRAVYFDAMNCTTAKYFAIDNFHLEHVPRDGGLCFRSYGSTVEVKGLFLQMGGPNSPSIKLENNGNYIFSNIPYWPESAWVSSSHSPGVVIEKCTPKFYQIERYWRNDEKKSEKIFRGYFRTDDMLKR